MRAFIWCMCITLHQFDIRCSQFINENVSQFLSVLRSLQPNAFFEARSLLLKLYWIALGRDRALRFCSFRRMMVNSFSAKLLSLSVNRHLCLALTLRMDLTETSRLANVGASAAWIIPSKPMLRAAVYPFSQFFECLVDVFFQGRGWYFV